MTLHRRLSAAALAGLLVAGLLPGPVFAVIPVAAPNSDTLLEDVVTTLTLSASDADGEAIQSFTIVTPPTLGTLGAVSAPTCTAVPTEPCTATVDYTPGSDANGADSFTFTATNVAAETSDPASFTLTITAVNDAPTFTHAGNQSVDEDSGATTVTGWASGDPGPADEAGQTLAYAIESNSNAALFAAGPAVAANGDLSWTAAANAFGTATIGVSVSDNGGTANGGDDTSATQTFTITLDEINDEPSFTKGGNQTIAEDAGPQTVNGWATGISAGAANESSQTLTFVLTPTNAGLFSAAPAVSATTGTLTYTPAANASGSSTVTIRLEDNGGTGNGGDDTSPNQTFTITVTAANDAPIAVDDSANVDEDSGANTIAVLGNDTDPDTGTNAGLTVSAVGTATKGTVAVGLAGANVTYTPNAGQTGADSFTYTVSDGALTDIGTVSVTIDNVNDPPTANDDTATVLEDAAATSINVRANDSTAPDTGETLTITAVTQPANGTVVITGGGTAVTYEPDADHNGSDSFTYTINDGNGGTDVGTVNVTITAVNDEPSLTTLGDRTILEDAGAQTVAGFATPDPGPANETGQTFTYTVNNDNTGLFSAQPSVAANGTLTYTPASNANGTATVTISVQDSGGVANGGDNTSASQTFDITVTSVNDVPSFTKGADRTVNEDAAPQSTAGWATAIVKGPADESTQTVDFIVTNDNNGLFSAQPAIAANGTLTWTPAANANGSATVSVRIHDNGGTANGGVDTSAIQTFTITVNAVNDVPSFTKGANQDELEDAGAQTVGAWATAISAGPANESAQTVSFTVTNDNNTLFSAQPAVAANGTLSFTPAANANGTATVTVRVVDSGGTALGGVDTSATQTFDIDVTSVNDAPAFTKGADQTVAEDSGLKTVIGWATSISRGPADESAQTLTFTLVPANPALFSVQPAVNTTTGTLTFTPAAQVSGSTTVSVTLADNGGTANGGADTSAAQQLTITISGVNDDPTATDDTLTVAEDAAATVVSVLDNDSTAPDTGETLSITAVGNPPKGTATITGGGTTVTYTPDANANGADAFSYTISDGNGGTDTGTVNVTITPVNDNPTLTGDTLTLLEDAATTPVNVLANDSGAPDTGETLTVTAAGTAGKGTPAVPVGGANVTYTPTANLNGTDSFTYTASDGNGGSAQATVNVTITPVNDEPSFTTLGNRTVAEDAGLQTVAGFAAGSAGPVDEAGQVLTYGLTNTNNALFSAQPAISAAGVLTFTPALNANGSAVVTVNLTDGGGTANGGDNAAPAQQFTITVTPVNDEPSFTAPGNRTVDEDAGAQTVAAFVTGSAGPANEAAQTLAYTVSNDANGLFSAQPSVAANGTLTFTPAANANGSATVSVHVTDSGGTAGGGDDTSAVAQFTITVDAVNDAPSFTGGADVDVLEDAGAQTVAGWATAMARGGGADEATQVLGFEVTANSAPGLFAAGPAVDPLTGDLTFTPADDANGAATVSIRITDDGGTANGGSSASAAQDLVITLGAVNDAPSFTGGADVESPEGSGAQTVPGWATAISAGPTDEAGQELTFEVTANSLPSLFATAPAIDATTGDLTFYPAANQSGTATIEVRLVDDGGTANGGADASAGATFAITIAGENDDPVATSDQFTVAKGLAVRLGAPVTLDVLANDSGGPGEPGDPVTITAITDTGNAGAFVTIAPDGRSLVYDPVGCTAKASQFFKYTITDGGGLTAEATVLVDLVNPASYPMVDGPRPSFVTGTPIGSTASVRMSWCGLTGSSSVRGYRLDQSTNDGSYVNRISSTKATSSVRILGFGPTRYQFRAKLTSSNGRTTYGTGPDFRVNRYQETGATYSTGWTTSRNSNHSGGTVKGTSTSGRSATFVYTGRSFAIVGPRGTTRGKFKVYVDGVYKVTVSERASSTQYRRVLYSLSLPQGRHTIKIVAAGSGRIDLDALLTMSGY